MANYLLRSSVVLLLWAADARLLDMTRSFDNTSLFWPNGQSAFELTILYKGLRPQGVWYQGEEYCSGTHVGTHMDAPCHFYKDKWSIEQIPLDRLVDRPAVMIDIRQKAALSPDVNVSLDDIERYERTHGQIARGAVVVQCSGWSERYPDVAAVFGNGDQDTADFHFPAFSAEAIRFLTEKRDIVGIAVDTPSLDWGQSIDFPVHIFCGSHNMYGIENVKDACLLPPVGATITSLPSKLRGSCGAPVRVFATWDNSRACSSRIHSFSRYLFLTLTVVACYCLIHQ